MSTIGKGTTGQPLTDAEVREICSLGLSTPVFDGKRVLVLIPDHTRHARIDLFFHIIYDLLAKRTKALDVPRAHTPIWSLGPFRGTWGSLPKSTAQSTRWSNSSITNMEIPPLLPRSEPFPSMRSPGSPEVFLRNRSRSRSIERSSSMFTVH